MIAPAEARPRRIRKRQFVPVQKLNVVDLTQMVAHRDARIHHLTGEVTKWRSLTLIALVVLVTCAIASVITAIL